MQQLLYSTHSELRVDWQYSQARERSLTSFRSELSGESSANQMESGAIVIPPPPRLGELALSENRLRVHAYNAPSLPAKYAKRRHNGCARLFSL